MQSYIGCLQPVTLLEEFRVSWSAHTFSFRSSFLSAQAESNCLHAVQITSSGPNMPYMHQYKYVARRRVFDSVFAGMLRCMTAQEDRKSDDRHDTRMLIVPLPSGSLTHPTLVSLYWASEISTESFMASPEFEEELLFCGNITPWAESICLRHR
jgi:hypothetical protein